MVIINKAMLASAHQLTYMLVSALTQLSDVPNGAVIGHRFHRSSQINNIDNT